MLVLRGIRITVCFFDILYCNKTAELVSVVYYGELFYLVLAENFLRLLKCCSDGDCDKVFLSHNVLNRHIVVGHEAEVAVCYDSDKNSVFITDRHTGNLILSHKLVCFIDIIVGMEEERVCNYAVFASLYSFNLVALLLDCHIFVDYSDTAFSRHSNSQRVFGYCVHSRAHQRNIKLDLFCEMRFQRYCAREDVAFCGNEENVVECDSFIRDLARDKVFRHLQNHTFLYSFHDRIHLCKWILYRL